MTIRRKEKGLQMRKRLGVVGAGAVAALAFASVALAAYSPTLTITRHVDAAGGSSTTDIAFAQTDADDPTASVVIYAPVGFTATLNQAPGTQIGTLEGSVVAGALAGATVPVGGTIGVGDPTNATLRAAAKQCTGSETHNAIWLLNVTAAGQSLPAPVPVYVDQISAPPFSTFASASIQLCLPHPSVATLGIKLLSATLHITNALAPPAAPGAYRWTAVNVPYNGGTNSINLA